MSQVTLSPESTIVRHQDIREALSLRPGDKLEVILYENRIELIPARPRDARLPPWEVYHSRPRP